MVEIVRIRRLAISIGLALGLAAMSFTAPMTDSAHANDPSKPVKKPAPSSGFTMKDMHDCAPSGSNSEFVCYGPDNKTYVCHTTGPCTRLAGW